MMKKIFIAAVFLLLTGCAGYMPRYHDSRYADVSLGGLEITDDVKAYVDGEPVEILRDGEPFIRVERRCGDRKLKLVRAGKDDLNFTLKRQLTDEKWAYGELGGDRIGTGDVSAAWLLLPTNTAFTLYFFGEGVGLLFTNPSFGAAMAGGSLAGLPVAVVLDVYNLFIGLPSTALINPWYNYRLEADTEDKPATGCR